MRIVQLNLAADPAIDDPDALLDRYHTLTGWSCALRRAGASVHVVQRFSTGAQVTRDDITYEFVSDGRRGTPAAWATFPLVVDRVARADGDVVHVNGLMFPGMTVALRAALKRPTVIVLQDHSGFVPRRTPWPYSAIRASRWARAFRNADAVSFTARDLALRWRGAGLPDDVPVIEMAEASTEFVAADCAEAQRSTGIVGSPAVLWVGRFVANKDPMTVLTGFEGALSSLPAARLWMIGPPGELLESVRQRIDASSMLRAHVTLLPPRPRHELPVCYSAADIFISGSRHEGSGYALIESMACGVLPCVTDIPAFRALTGRCGERWRPGDADGCGAALVRVASSVAPESRVAVRRAFDCDLSWEAIGHRTLDAYRRLVDVRREAHG